MKKFMILCFLIPALLLSAALAEETAPYVPGSLPLALFRDAFDRGEMVMMDLSLDLALNEAGSELFGEDAALISAAGEALGNAALTLGLGKTEDGLRLLLAGTYAADEKQAALDLDIELTPDGVHLMSSAVPGERFTAQWSTLLTLCGLSDEEIAQMLSLSSLDMQAVLSELSAQAAAYLGFFGQIAAPYGQTVLAHIEALPTEIRTDVPAESGFPAAATEISLQVTDKAVGDLLIALANQLEADTTLGVFINAALAESGEDVTTAQLCQAIRDMAAESLTDESTPLSLYVGMDDAGSLSYANAVITDETGESLILALIAKPSEDAPQYTQFTLDLLTLNAADEILDGFSFIALYPAEPDENTAVDLQLYLEMYADGEAIILAESALHNISGITEDNQPAQNGEYTLNVTLPSDDEDVAILFAAESAHNLMSGGSEESALVATLDLVAGEETLPLSYNAYHLTEQGEGGPVTSLTSHFTAPAFGVELYTESAMLYTAAYAPDLSAVADIALETASEQELEAFAARAMTSLENTISTLAQLLPEELAF